MSIETEVKKLAATQVQLTDALVKLTTVLEANIASAANTIKTPVSSTNISQDPPAAQQPVPQVAEKPEPTTVPVPNVPTATVPRPQVQSEYTPRQVNEILGSVALKMGDNGVAVRAIMAEYNANVVMDIPPGKYAEVVAKVQALGAPA